MNNSITPQELNKLAPESYTIIDIRDKTAFEYYQGRTGGVSEGTGAGLCYGQYQPFQ